MAHVLAIILLITSVVGTFIVWKYPHTCGCGRFVARKSGYVYPDGRRECDQCYQNHW